MGMEEVITQMAQKSFMKELNNPNSPIAKKFQDMLYGNKTTGQGGLFEKMLNEAPSTITQGDKPVTRSNAEIEAEMQNYKRKTKETVLDNVLNSGGTLLKGAGDMAGGYHNLLGDALLAVSAGLGSQGFDNPFAMTAAAAAGKKAKGMLLQKGLNTLGDVTKEVGSDLKHEREKDKETELLLRERPSGQFYDSRKQLTKNR